MKRNDKTHIETDCNSQMIISVIKKFNALMTLDDVHINDKIQYDVIRK